MNMTTRVHRLTLAAVLCAIGIIIPIVSPLKIILEPASFTLASHVPIFIAMFISPITALSVSVITALGFLFGGFPIVIVLRAATHVIFALVGALMLRNRSQWLESIPKMLLFSFVLACIHAICEVIVVTPFYVGNSLKDAFYTQGFMVSVILLVGVGTIVHSMVDFFIAFLVWKPLRKMKALQQS